MKTFIVTEYVKIKNPDGSIRATVPVKLNGYIDEFTGEKSFTAAELMKLDRIKAQYAGIMLPEEIKALRKRFNKTQDEMCDILSLGGKTWTRWETGAVIPNPSMCKTLFLLKEGKIALEDLCAQKKKCVDNLLNVWRKWFLPPLYVPNEVRNRATDTNEREYSE